MDTIGVFVDEDAETMMKVLDETGVRIAQLHGRVAKKSRKVLKMRGFRVVDVIHVERSGEWRDLEGIEENQGEIAGSDELHESWKLFDSGKGSGKCFDWKGFERPKGKWLLAGGLNPENVGDAVRWLRPWGIDVASGVAGKDGCEKDGKKVQEFLENALEAAASK